MQTGQRMPLQERGVCGREYAAGDEHEAAPEGAVSRQERGVERNATHARHAEVADHGIEGLVSLEAPRGISAARRDLDGDVDPKVELREVRDHRAQRLGEQAVVVHDEDPSRRLTRGPTCLPLPHAAERYTEGFPTP